MSGRARAAALAVVSGTVFPLAASGAAPLAMARFGLCGAALGAAAAIDLAEHRIPNRLVVPATVVCAALSLGGGWPTPGIVAGLALVVLLGLVSIAKPKALGMGDVKLALLLVGGLDGDAVRALLAGLLLAALAGFMVLARYGRAGGRIALPLAPFLAAGSLVAVLT